VIGSSLVASRVVSMTFIPLIGYYLLRPKAEPTLESGARAASRRSTTRSAPSRSASLAFLSASLAGHRERRFFMSQLKTNFFPQDLQYLSYVECGCRKTRPWRPPNDRPPGGERGAARG
jgi:multidrug efflux pump subunit AcrB